MMKRYVWETEGGAILFRVTPYGGWVSYDDAEAEIEKARKEGYDTGYAWHLLIDGRGPLKTSEPKPFCTCGMEKPHHETWCLCWVAEPKALENLVIAEGSTERLRKLNALIDAVNDLTRRFNFQEPR